MLRLCFAAIQWSSGQNSTARVNPSVQYNIGGTVVVTVQVQVKAYDGKGCTQLHAC